MKNKQKDYKHSHYHSCRRKHRYISEHEAMRAIKKIQSERPGEILDVYFCGQCCGWHLTKAMECNIWEESDS